MVTIRPGTSGTVARHRRCSHQNRITCTGCVPTEEIRVIRVDLVGSRVVLEESPYLATLPRAVLNDDVVTGRQVRMIVVENPTHVDVRILDDEPGVSGA